MTLLYTAEPWYLKNLHKEPNCRLPEGVFHTERRSTRYQGAAPPHKSSDNISSFKTDIFFTQMELGYL